MEYLVNLATAIAHERLDDAKLQAALSCCIQSSAPAATCVETSGHPAWLRQGRCVPVAA